METITSANNYFATSKNRKWPTAVDIYCGSGAVTAALKQAHFKVVSAIDNDPIACETYRMNHGRTHLYEGDIHNIDPKDIRETDLGNAPLDLLVVCAPCQPFSSQNKKRGNRTDLRTNLILEAVRFAAILKPKHIFFENVAGMTTPKFRPLLEELGAQLNELDYILSPPQRIDAAQFSVPQRRIRCIMMASSKKYDTTFDFKKGKRPLRTVRDTISHLSSLTPGESSKSDSLHKARNHSDLAIKRLKKIPKNGGSRFSLPAKLELACHRNFTGHPDVYGRMEWDNVAPTLTTGCTDITKGRFAHPEQNRAITLREAALLQTFPDTYRFHGNSGDIARQIGNAVPVEMAKELFKQIRPNCV